MVHLYPIRPTAYQLNGTWVDPITSSRTSPDLPLPVVHSVDSVAMGDHGDLKTIECSMLFYHSLCFFVIVCGFPKRLFPCF